MRITHWPALFLAPLVTTALLSAQPATDIPALEHRVESVEFRDTPIRDVLRLLAEQNDLNLIIGPDSMGTVSLRLTGVTLRAALDAILRAKGYQYTLFDNILMVSTPDSLEKMRGLGLTSQVFHLQFVDARDVKSVIDTAKVLSPWGSASVYAATLKNDAGQAAQLIRAAQQGAISTGGTGGGGGASLQQPPRLSARANALIVNDRPSNLRAVARLIEELDKPLKQLVIDVHFVETILDDESRMGIDWTQLLSVEGAYRRKTDWQLGGAAPAGRPGGAGVIQLGSLSEARFRAVLDMMLTDNRANLLSQPRIITLDNQPASIFVGVTTWIESRTGSEETGGIQISYAERQVPIELIVVPHVIADGRIQLELQPRVEEITGWQQGAQGLQLPIISTRTADSRIEVLDGETAIIGGLLKEKSIWVVNKVWLLGSVPLIGHLFRNKQEQKQRTDLTIFITTRILDKGGLTRSPDDAERPEPPKPREPAAKPQEAPAPESSGSKGIDLTPFFPLANEGHWGFQWQHVDGRKWPGEIRVLSARQGQWVVEEFGADMGSSERQVSGYTWAPEGLVAAYGKGSRDSVAYSPSLMVLPAMMEENRIYETSHDWRRFRANRQIESGRLFQRQSLLGFYNVTTQAGRFRNCLAVQTESWQSGQPAAARKRQVTWYAPGVGPVKVEMNIPPDDGELKGKFSAILIAR